MEKAQAASWFSEGNKLFNSGQSPAREGQISPWSMVLACEGVDLFAGGVSRRLGTRARSLGAFPFVIGPAAPTGSGEAGRDRGEVWAPLWTRPAVLAEVQAIFSRGRAEVGSKCAVTPAAFADLRMATAGDPCPRCDHGALECYRGIEVGQIFYLGKKYSETMGATYLDSEGRERPMEMGCYGIGITRLLAAAIEQNHDANGIIWPFSIAPFHVLLLPVQYRDKALREVADSLYDELLKRGMEVLLDDRDERPGVKFKDADLVGIPLRVTVGAKGLEKGCVEVRWRREGQMEEVSVGEAANKIQTVINEALKV